MLVPAGFALSRRWNPEITLNREMSIFAVPRRWNLKRETRLSLSARSRRGISPSAQECSCARNKAQSECMCDLAGSLQLVRCLSSHGSPFRMDRERERERDAQLRYIVLYGAALHSASATLLPNCQLHKRKMLVSRKKTCAVITRLPHSTPSVAPVSERFRHLVFVPHRPHARFLISGRVQETTHYTSPGPSGILRGKALRSARTSVFA